MPLCVSDLNAIYSFNATNAASTNCSNSSMISSSRMPDRWTRAEVLKNLLSIG